MAFSRWNGTLSRAFDVEGQVDSALLMVEALTNDAPIHETPATVGCRPPAALAHGADAGMSTDR